MHAKYALGAILFILLAMPAVFAGFEFVSVSYQPAPTNPGELTTLYITVKNNSNTASDPITVTVKPGYPFSLGASGKTEQKFDTILAQQTGLAVIELQVDSAALNGTYSIDVQIKNPAGLVIAGRPFNITVTAVKPQIGIVGISQDIGQPGQLLPVTLTIRNVGSSIAKNIFVGTSNERTVTTTGVVVDIPIKNTGTSLYYIESMEPNQTADVPMRLGIDSTAEQKTYVVPITIKFQDTNRTDYALVGNIGIRVQGDAQLDASTTPSDKTKLYPGGTGNASINLFNRGNAIARNIVVTVEDNPILTLQSEKTIFIGTLDPDDFDSFNLAAKVKADTKSGTYPLNLTFEYKNQDYETKTVSRTIQLQIFSAEDAKVDTGSPIGTIAIIAVLLVIGYFGYKRFWKKNPSGTKR